MADVKLSRTHGMTVAQAKKVAQKVADDMAKEYDLQSEWDGDTLYFERTGVKGFLEVDGSAMNVEVTLGFLFKPFAGKFRDTMSANFDKLLAPPAAKKPAPKKRA
jgi:putative polyhydroxyalkanoate system protein